MSHTSTSILTICAVAFTATAQSVSASSDSLQSALSEAVEMLGDSDPTKTTQAAFAACLQNGSFPWALEELFTDAGWHNTGNVGDYRFHRHGADVSVQFDDFGMKCIITRTDVPMAVMYYGVDWLLQDSAAEGWVSWRDEGGCPNWASKSEGGSQQITVGNHDTDPSPCIDGRGSTIEVVYEQ